MLKKVLICMVSIFLLTGCSSPGMKNKEVFQQPQQTAKPVQTPEPAKSVQAPELKEEQPKETPKPSPAAPVQPPPRIIKGEKLNFEPIDKLDNTKYGWWMQLKGRNTPGFGQKESQLVKKYGGIYLEDTSKKVVYLTFDEGYENGYTPKILDVLKENNTKAAFFITSDYLKTSSALVKRMIDEGHIVGNHTVKHPHMTETASAVLEEEILGLEKEVAKQFGKGMKLFRPPYGEFSERTLAITQQLGYKTVMWSFAYLDWDVNNQKGADHAYNVVMNNLHNGAVYLLHAVSRDNAEALDRIIKGIKAEGYEIKLLE